MNAHRDWLAEIDGAEHLDPLRAVLADLAAAIDNLENSAYAGEDAVRDQVHTLELLAHHGEQKLARLLK